MFKFPKKQKSIFTLTTEYSRKKYNNLKNNTIHKYPLQYIEYVNYNCLKLLQNHFLYELNL